MSIGILAALWRSRSKDVLRSWCPKSPWPEPSANASRIEEIALGVQHPRSCAAPEHFDWHGLTRAEWPRRRQRRNAPARARCRPQAELSPNQSGRNLRRGATQSIAFMLQPHPGDQQYGELFFIPFLTACRRSSPNTDST